LSDGQAAGAEAVKREILVEVGVSLLEMLALFIF
jgi:hypothetical protein